MRYRSNNILALIPPQTESDSVLKQVLFFQKSLNMRVFIYNIIDNPSIIDRIIHAKRTRNMRNDALNELRNFIYVRTSSSQKNQLTFRIKTGKTLPILTRQSKKGGYEFLMVDKSETGSGLKPDELERLISRAYCPVLSLNNGHTIKEIKNIVIPVDISQSTKKKLLWATYFAKKFGAEITIVSALGLNIDTKKSLAWRNAEKLKHMLTQRGVTCKVEILKAFGKEKHEVILDYLEKVKPGLVILRTHQESNLAETQIGKFVSSLVKGCKMPVFTVNRFIQPIPVDFGI
jgi:nucleotide-binding universal stress UspA family protein